LLVTCVGDDAMTCTVQSGKENDGNFIWNPLDHGFYMNVDFMNYLSVPGVKRSACSVTPDNPSGGAPPADAASGAPSTGSSGDGDDNNWAAALKFDADELARIAHSQDAPDPPATNDDVSAPPGKLVSATALLQDRAAAKRRQPKPQQQHRRRFGHRLGHRMPSVRRTLRGKK